MSAFGCDCPHSVLEHESSGTGARCTLCNCVVTREQMLAFMNPGPRPAPAAWPIPSEQLAELRGLHERQVGALERIADAVERLVELSTPPPQAPYERPPPTRIPGGGR